MIRDWTGAITVCTLTLGLTASAFAAPTTGNLLGVFAGDGGLAELQQNLNVDLGLLAEVVWPSASADGLLLSDLEFVGADPVGGEWRFDGIGTANLLVIGVDGQYAAYDVAVDNEALNAGHWSTDDLAGAPMTYLRIYSLTAYAATIPEPVTAAVFTLGAAALVRRRRR
jgi:hypothetical protein